MVTGVMGIEAGICITVTGTNGNGFVTGGVMMETNGITDAEDEAMGSSARDNDGTSTGEADCEREGV
jgi:hypothetical protein